MNLYLTPQQHEVVACKARFISYVAGRRVGKSTTAALRAIARTNEPDFRYTYITPTYAQLVEQYRRIAFCPGFRQYIASTKLQPFPEVVRTNGSRFSFRTFERPENLKGTGEDEVWVDEIQDIKADAFWPVIRPLLSDRRGTLVVSGQFRGIGSWYYEQLYLPGTDPERNPLYKSFRVPSSEGLMFQSREGREELEIARSQLPRVIYEEQYECLPVANQHGAFDAQDVAAIMRGMAQSAGRPGRTYVMGLDLGRVKDYSALVVLELQTGEVIHAEKLPLGMKHEIQAQHVARVAARYNALVIIDSTGGATGGHEKTDAFLQYYRKLIPALRPFYWNRSNKERIIQHLMLQVEQRTISIPVTFTEIKAELLTYEFEYKNGFYNYHAQDGKHDDYVSALAMAVWAKHLGWGPTTSGAPLSALV